MGKKIKKDFDKEQMYSKIMPSIVTLPPTARQDAFFGAVVLEERDPEEEHPLILRNLIEDIVLDKLEHTMDMLRCCDCEHCKKEVMAKALNELPTAYAVVGDDELEETVRQLRQAYEVKVSSALIRAVQEVKAAPKHASGR